MENRSGASQKKANQTLGLFQYYDHGINTQAESSILKVCSNVATMRLVSTQCFFCFNDDDDYYDYYYYFPELLGLGGFNRSGWFLFNPRPCHGQSLGRLGCGNPGRASASPRLKCRLCAGSRPKKEVPAKRGGHVLK